MRHPPSAVEHKNGKGGPPATLTQSYTYDSFGKVTASSGSLVNPFQYTGRDSDSDTGLYYYRARYYDPSVGRFITEDPIGFGGGVNFYSYVLNNSLNWIDPFGLDTTVIIVYDKSLGVTYGSHAALLIDNGGHPILYDPAGSYAPDHRCGSGDACAEVDADLSLYQKYHQKNGSTVKSFVFHTTPQEEEQIANRILQIGGAAPFYCASFVSRAIQGIGPFKNLKGSGWPGELGKQLDLLLPKPSGTGGAW
jgi:RHS repeat-associated protein